MAALFYHSPSSVIRVRPSWSYCNSLNLLQCHTANKIQTPSPLHPLFHQITRTEHSIALSSQPREKINETYTKPAPRGRLQSGCRCPLLLTSLIPWQSSISPILWVWPALSLCSNLLCAFSRLLSIPEDLFLGQVHLSSLHCDERTFRIYDSFIVAVKRVSHLVSFTLHAYIRL